MRRFLIDIVLLGIVLASVFVYREPLSIMARQLYAQILPCTRPISYSISTLDSRFGVSEAELLSAIQDAEEIWEKQSKRDLFKHTDTNGVLKINLIYDYRQETTEKLGTLGVAVDNSRASYDVLKAKYDSLIQSYEKKKGQFEIQLTTFQKVQGSYNENVQYWNGRGGAPRAQFRELQSQKESLQNQSAELQQLQNALNVEADDINAVVEALNHTAGVLNLNVARYNNVGASVGDEYEEGLYQSSAGKQEINIYEYGNRTELVRVLAHEMGHALGLRHVEDNNAIMYRLNEGSNETVTEADIQELNNVCERGFSF